MFPLERRLSASSPRLHRRLGALPGVVVPDAGGGTSTRARDSLSVGLRRALSVRFGLVTLAPSPATKEVQ